MGRTEREGRRKWREGGEGEGEEGKERGGEGEVGEGGEGMKEKRKRERRKGEGMNGRKVVRLRTTVQLVHASCVCSIHSLSSHSPGCGPCVAAACAVPSQSGRCPPHPLSSACPAGWQWQCRCRFDHSHRCTEEAGVTKNHTVSCDVSHRCTQRGSNVTAKYPSILSSILVVVS